MRHWGACMNSTWMCPHATFLFRQLLLFSSSTIKTIFFSQRSLCVPVAVGLVFFSVYFCASNPIHIINLRVFMRLSYASRHLMCVRVFVCWQPNLFSYLRKNYDFSLVNKKSLQQFLPYLFLDVVICFHGHRTVSNMLFGMRKVVWLVITVELKFNWHLGWND